VSTVEAVTANKDIIEELTNRSNGDEKLVAERLMLLAVLGRIVGDSQEVLLEVEQLVETQEVPVLGCVVGSTGGTGQGCKMSCPLVLG